MIEKTIKEVVENEINELKELSNVEKKKETLHSQFETKTPPIDGEYKNTIIKEPKTIYETNEWHGYGKQNYYKNVYEQDGDIISKYKCHRSKFFDGKENTWSNEKNLEASWEKNDPNLPEWLKQYIK